MKCPSCKTDVPTGKTMCECGYEFNTGKKALYRSISDMSHGEFFANSWRIFFSNWATFIILAAVPTVLFTTLGLARELEASSLAAYLAPVLSVIIWAISSMALIMAAHKTSERESVGVLESYTLSFVHFWRFIGTNLLYTLICFLGFLLLIIPGIIWGIRYVFAPSLVILEGVGVKNALSRSRELTQNRLFNLWAREFVFGLLFILLIAIPFNLLTFLAGYVIHNLGYTSSEISFEWLQTISLLGNFCTAVLFVIFNVLLIKSIQVFMIKAQKLIDVDDRKEEIVLAFDSE